MNGVKLDHILLRPGDPLHLHYSMHSIHLGRDLKQVEAVCLRLVGAGGLPPNQALVDTCKSVRFKTTCWQEISAALQAVHTVSVLVETGPGPLDLLHQQREVELVPVVRTVKMSLDILDI